MKKGIKKIGVGFLAGLMLFGGMFTPMSVRASEYIGFDPLCMTGAPAGVTGSYRMLRRTPARRSDNTNTIVHYPAGAIINRRGQQQFRTFNGIRYTLLHPGTLGMWIRVNDITPLNIC